MPIPSKARVTLIALVYAFVVYHCFFTGLSSFGLVGPDEPRYASIAREMARSGDWITPRLNGEPWFEKPPLYYWSAAVGFLVFKNPEVAARAPSGVFALLAVLSVFVVARRFYSRTVASTVAWMLPASVGMTGFAHAAATDMPFAACLALAMVAAAFLLLDEQPAHRAAWTVASGAALGLATLAKGPAAILLTGGSVALWAVASGNIRRGFRLFHPQALAAFFIVALPWYVLCALRNPEFLRIFFLEHNVERFLTNRFQHQQPFWFFVPVLLLAAFPWTLLLIPAASDAWRALHTAAWRTSPALFFVAWTVFPFVFFSASQSKLPGYILPAVAPLVILLALAWEVPAGALRGRIAWAALALLLTGPSALAAVVFSSRRALLSGGIEADLMLLAAVLIAGGLAVACVSYLRRTLLLVAVASFVVAFAAGIAANHLLRAAGPDISAQAVAVLARQEVDGASLVTYKLSRAWHYGLEFYLDRPLQIWTPQTPRPVWLVTTVEGVYDLRMHGQKLDEVPGGSARAQLYRME